MLKLTIEDTGIGVTFAGDPGKYRVWRGVDPNGEPFLHFGRSVMHNGTLTAPAPIGKYIELTEEMMKQNESVDDLLAALRQS